jgi:hypothetical protein
MLLVEEEWGQFEGQVFKVSKMFNMFTFKFFSLPRFDCTWLALHDQVVLL